MDTGAVKFTYMAEVVFSSQTWKKWLQEYKGMALEYKPAPKTMDRSQKCQFNGATTETQWNIW